MADEIVVMHEGRIVEYGTCDDVYTTPTHAHTRELRAAIPCNGLACHSGGS